MDLVGYGTANCSETSPAASSSVTTALFRAGAGCTDTDHNLNDFTVAFPMPRNLSSDGTTCSCP